MIKICGFCGNPFEVDENNHHERQRKYCSALCLRNRNNAEQKKGKQLRNLICVVCGKVFLASRRDRVCCSPECSEERNKQLAKERFKQKYWENKTEKKPKEPQKRKIVVPAHEIEAEARKLGMHYGTYTAMLQMEKEREVRHEQKKKLLSDTDSE